MSDVSESLISLTKNERTWAIRSGRSEEMSDHERIAQVAHQKWANEWIPHFFEQIAHSLIFGQKTSYSLGNQMSEFPARLYSLILVDVKKEEYSIIGDLLNCLIVVKGEKEELQSALEEAESALEQEENKVRIRVASFCTL